MVGSENSRIDEGTTFIIWLPAYVTEPLNSSDETDLLDHQPKMADRSGRPVKVLVIDDEDLVRSSTEALSTAVAVRFCWLIPGSVGSN